MSHADRTDGGSGGSARAAVGGLLVGVRSRLRKLVLVFLAVMVGTILFMRSYGWPFLKSITRSKLQAETAQQVAIIVQTPFDVILLQVKLGAIAGFLATVPVALYLSRDALRGSLGSTVPITRRKLAAIVAMGAGLFALGVVYAYALFFPVMFGFLVENALAATIQPKYSIVLWTQFVLVMTLSFGLAAQLPLAMGALSYAEIVPYEFFRSKWRYAMVAIVAFGAVFSPPDPITQLMWGVPLAALYFVSLALAKLVTNLRRAEAVGDLTPWPAVARATVGGTAGGLLGVGVVIALPTINDGLAAVDRIVADASAGLPISPSVGRLTATTTGDRVAIVGALAAVGIGIVLVSRTVAILRAPVRPRPGPGANGTVGDPAAIDLDALDAGGIRAAPPEPFVAMSESEAVEMAEAAIADGDAERARAILDRYDEVGDSDDGTEGDTPTSDREAGEYETNHPNVHPPSPDRFPGTTDDPATGGDDRAVDDSGGSWGGERADRARSVGSIANETATGVATAFAGDRDRDEIGGYIHDLRFVAAALRSKGLWLFALFLTVTFASFIWLYSGGLGRVKRDFLARIPAETLAVAGASGPGDVGLVIALHPVEALIFEVKVSALLGIVALLPVLGYYAWPTVRDRGLAGGDRRTFLAWGGSLIVTLAVGIVLGYTTIAPAVISYLVGDALDAGVLLAYRLKAFFWLVILLTVGIGFLVEIPVTMALFHLGGIADFGTMWRFRREFVAGIFVAAALVTPSGAVTMLVVALPIAVVYYLGLGVLWLVTLPGRTARADPS
ncbi:hypothetical protein BRD17_08575 [Halobacteriales archaeon SW_7_68_16]|nr:MAG: hypothetical protein BRD17_08575 [Halobacteriales archaeon SW_7_68_16]